MSDEIKYAFTQDELNKMFSDIKDMSIAEGKMAMLLEVKNQYSHVVPHTFFVARATQISSEAEKLLKGTIKSGLSKYYGGYK